MKLVVATEREEILKVIQEAKHKQKNILWQTRADARTILEITNIEYDPVREVVRCQVDSPESLDSELHIYIKLGHRNTVFKGSLTLKYNNYVYIKVPDEIRLEELREFPRYTFFPEERRKVKISVLSDFVTDAREHHDVNLIDMSRSGIGLLISQGKKDIILSSTDITLSELGNFEFKSLLSMQPVWQVDFPFKDEMGTPELCKKVGFKFAEPIPGKLLVNYIKLEEGQFENEIGFLGQSTTFKKKLHKEYKTMYEKVKNKKKFFDFFQEASVSDEMGMDYLPRHIRILAYSSCALARLVGINNKDALRQLTYISFVHDIAYFNNPKLAQIKSREHFEKVKKYLTISEKELYYRSYNYAFEFAQSDKNAPAGSDFLLHKLREYHLAADKESFLSREEMSPLVAIFIVAHHLTNYIIMHPQWTFYDYLETYPFLIHGKTFEQIFNNLNRARMAA